MAYSGIFIKDKIYSTVVTRFWKDCSVSTR